MSLQQRKQDVDKFNSTRGTLKTNDRVPPAMAVVRFAALANLNGGLDLQALARRVAKQIGIPLVVIMFEHRALIHSVGKHVCAIGLAR